MHYYDKDAWLYKKTRSVRPWEWEESAAKADGSARVCSPGMLQVACVDAVTATAGAAAPASAPTQRLSRLAKQMPDPATRRLIEPVNRNLPKQVPIHTNQTLTVFTNFTSVDVEATSGMLWKGNQLSHGWIFVI